MTILMAVAILSLSAPVLASTLHPNYQSLEHVAEALSCFGVLDTLQTYSSVTAPSSKGRGPFLTQLVRLTEYWFLATSALAFLGEASHGFLFTKFHHEGEDHPIVVLLDAFRQNQDSGFDDWTRLLIHSIFLNSIDELQHFTSGQAQAENGNDGLDSTETGEEMDSFVGQGKLVAISKPLRSRHTQGSD